MSELGSKPPLLSSSQLDNEGGLSSEETMNLISRLLDTKLDKKFTEFSTARIGLNESRNSFSNKKIENRSESSEYLSFQK